MRVCVRERNFVTELTNCDLFRLVLVLDEGLKITGEVKYIMDLLSLRRLYLKQLLVSGNEKYMNLLLTTRCPRGISSLLRIPDFVLRRYLALGEVLCVEKCL